MPPTAENSVAPSVVTPSAEHPSRGVGRPSNATRAYAAKFATDAIDVLVALMKAADKDQVRVAAACAILDRADGKPTAPVEPKSPDGALSSLSAEQIRALLTAARRLGSDG